MGPLFELPREEIEKRCINQEDFLKKFEHFRFCNFWGPFRAGQTELENSVQTTFETYTVRSHTLRTADNDWRRIRIEVGPTDRCCANANSKT